MTGTTDADAPARADALVRTATRVGAPPLVPEVRLHLADEPYALWQRTEDEGGAGPLPPPFWAFAWAGGQAVARYVLDSPGLVAGRRVLDLATGSGLVAIAAALAGAAAVTAVDVDPLAVAAVDLNAGLNGVAAAAVRAVRADVLDGDAGDADVVLAGDVFYDRRLVARVMPFLDRARAAGATVLVGDPGRAHLPRGRFAAVATYDVPVPPALEEVAVKRTTVWRPA